MSAFFRKRLAGPRQVGALTAMLLLLLVSVAGATSITFSVSGTQSGLPVSATATFVTSANTVTITLTNLQNNPKSVIQNLSDLIFVLSGGQTSGTLTSSSALARTVHSNGTFTDGGTVATGWELETFGSGLRLHVLSTLIGPAHTLIGGPDGSNVYSNANGSIAGNGPHNPFITGAASFNLAVPDISGTSTITSAVFSFGTTEGNNVTGTCLRDCTPPPPQVVPEPSTWIMLMTGTLCLLGYGWSRRHVHQDAATSI